MKIANFNTGYIIDLAKSKVRQQLDAKQVHIYRVTFQKLVISNYFYALNSFVFKLEKTGNRMLG